MQPRLGPFSTPNVLFEVCAVTEADPAGRRALWIASGTAGLREAWLADLDDVAGTRVKVAEGYRMGRPVWHADSGRFVIAHKQDSEAERLIVQAINPDLPEGPHSFATFDFGSSPLGDAYHCVVRPGADEGGASPAPVQVVSGVSLYEVGLDAAGQFGLIELEASLIENFPAADADGIDPDGTDASARILTAAEGAAEAGTTRASQPQIGTRDQLVTGLDVRRVAVLPGGAQGERITALVRNANGTGSLRRSTEPSPFRLDALSTEVATTLVANQAVTSWDGVLAAIVESGRLYTLDVETAARALVAALDPNQTGRGADALYMAVAQALVAVNDNLLLDPDDFTNAAAWQQVGTGSGSGPMYQFNNVGNPLDPSGTAGRIYNTQLQTVLARGTVSGQIDDGTIETAGSVTLSVYAHAGSEDWVRLQGRATTGQTTRPFGYFDLVNGVVGTTHASVTNATIEDAGEGWWRCRITFPTGTGAEGPEFEVVLAESNGDVTAGANDTVWMWGPKYEVGTDMTDFVPGA